MDWDGRKISDNIRELVEIELMKNTPYRIISEKYGVHPNTLMIWRKKLGLPQLRKSRGKIDPSDFEYDVKSKKKLKTKEQLIHELCSMAYKGE